MSNDPPQNDHESSRVDATSVSKGHPWIAWCVIVVVAALVIWRHGQPDRREKQVIENRLLARVGDWQSRYLVGAAKMFPQKESSQFADAAPVDSGPIDQRLRAVAVVGEISGAKAAAAKLRAVQNQIERQDAGEQDRKTAEVLGRLYGDLERGKPTLPSLVPGDRRHIAERLGWSGRLALHPTGGAEVDEREALLIEARSTITTSLFAFTAIAALALGGLGVLLTILVLLVVRPRARALEPATPRGAIYAETFAVWIALYVALSYAAALLPLRQHPLLLTMVIMLGSLAALGWPTLRGIPWNVVCDDVGLRPGRRPFVELLLGPVCYLSALPLVAVGVLLIVAMMAIERKLTGNVGGELTHDLPSHPIVGWLLDSKWWEKLQVVALASVAAPLMEETMFRGVLYRHLRDATGRFGYVMSVLTSSFAVSFVFAAIHPQGWLGVPVLMALALAFNLAREWRGTLLPAMLMHGLNNFLVTCLLMALT